MQPMAKFILKNYKIRYNISHTTYTSTALSNIVVSKLENGQITCKAAALLHCSKSITNHNNPQNTLLSLITGFVYELSLRGDNCMLLAHRP